MCLARIHAQSTVRPTAYILTSQTALSCFAMPRRPAKSAPKHAVSSAMPVQTSAASCARSGGRSRTTARNSRNSSTSASACTPVSGTKRERGSRSSSDHTASDENTEQPPKAFSVPTVSVEVDAAASSDLADDGDDLSLVWRVPTCASDFTQEWVQFVMQQYYANVHGVELKQKIENFTVVAMAGSPEMNNDQNNQNCNDEGR